MVMAGEMYSSGIVVIVSKKKEEKPWQMCKEKPLRESS